MLRVVMPLLGVLNDSSICSVSFILSVIKASVVGRIVAAPFDRLAFGLIRFVSVFGLTLGENPIDISSEIKDVRKRLSHPRGPY